MVHILYRLPLALDDVDVRAAEPRGPDAHDHIEGILYLRLVYLLDRETVTRDAVIVAVQSRCFHAVSSSGSSIPLRAARTPLQNPAFDSMLSRVTLANRRCCITASSGIFLPSGSTTNGASAEMSSPSSSLRLRYFSLASEDGTSPSRIPASSTGW